MNLLIAMRVVTLAGWIALAGCLIYIAAGPGRASTTPVRAVWPILACRQVTIAITTAFVESAWVLSAVAQDSRLFQMAKAMYNPAYVANASVDAVVPLLVVFVLAGATPVRRIAIAAVVAGVVLAAFAVISGATRDWDVLMIWAQILGFYAIAGYLTFWGLLVLGHLVLVDRYLMGLLAVMALFAILLPVQAVFFKSVGKADAAQIWHLNEFLQLAAMSAELTIATAYVHAKRHGKQESPEPAQT